MNKTAYMGGTFDPVHLGHLLIAQDVYEHFALRQVVFLPNARNPLKEGGPMATGEQRIAMIQAAIGDDTRFDVSDLEVNSGESVSYTFDTVARIHEAEEERVAWIIGSDQLPDLHRWHRIDELVEIAEFICCDRPGTADVEIPRIQGLRLHRLGIHLFDVSSSEIRKRALEHKPLTFFLPAAVQEYITAHKLYDKASQATPIDYGRLSHKTQSRCAKPD